MAGRKKQSLLRSKIRKVPRFIISLVKKIPSVVWGGFAVFGIFIFGTLVGTSIPDSTSSPPLENKSSQYLEVVDSYKTLSKLYYYQQQDMDIVIDSNKWQDNYSELYEAIASYKQKRDEIIFQLGRVYELSKRAGLQANAPQ